jgi:hypothetical protein
MFEITIEAKSDKSNATYQQDEHRALRMPMGA